MHSIEGALRALERELKELVETAHAIYGMEDFTPVQLPLTSLDDDKGVTRNALVAQKGSTIIVGHSYGGVVISGAANDAPSVTALVYICGLWAGRRRKHRKS